MGVAHHCTATSTAIVLLLGACSSESSQDGGQGGVGARGAPSVILDASSVVTVGRDTIEDGVPITGNLRPIETVEIRARLEGDIIGVYAREGQRVRKGQVLARFENSEQESGQRSAEADRVAAQTELSTAQWNLEQAEELLRAGAIPERDLKTAQQGVATSRARLAAANAQLRSTSSFVRDTRVLAPTSGVVESRNVEDGEHVARGAALFTVVRSDVLELAAAVPARRAGAVAADQRVRFNADGRTVEGRVARVSPTIDPATRAVTVYVEIPNPDGSLKGGTFASGLVIGRSKPNALIVPATALRQGQEDGRSFVYRIEGDRLAQAPVGLGVVDEARGIAEVLSGLTEGDRIVVGNVGTLGNGMKVEIMGAEGTAAGSLAAPAAAGRVTTP